MLDAYNPNFSRSTGRGVPGFADPFCDAASLVMPTSIEDSHRWTEQILLSSQGTYRSALERVVSYFMTSLVVGDENTDRKEKEQYSKYAEKEGVLSKIRTIGIDYLSYGTVLLSVLQPFRRYVICPGKVKGGKGCGVSVPFSEFTEKKDYQWEWKNFEIHGKCPKCGYKGDFGKPKDMPADSDTPLTIRRWNLKQIEILWHPISERCKFYWKIPSSVSAPIKKGIAFFIEDTPWEVIEAIRDTQWLELSKENLLHLHEDTLSGVEMNGWGLSRVLANFRQAYYVQVLHRFNEAIAMDYVSPFRVLSPEPKNGADPLSSDPVHMMDLGGFKSIVTSMVEERRYDPAKWFVSPIPIKYSVLGGDAEQLAPKELIELGQQQLLDSIGIFVELYRGSLDTQAAPLALRLHESFWRPLVFALNQMTSFIFKKTAEYYHWEPADCKLESPTHSDDIQRSAIKMQAAQMGDISKGTAYAPLGIDYEAEQKKSLEEQQNIAQLQADAQKDMERTSQMTSLVQPPNAMSIQPPPPPGAAPAGAPPAGGAPPAPGGAAPPPGAAPVSPTPPAGAVGPDGAPVDPNQAAAQFIAGMIPQPNMPVTPEELTARAQTISDTLMQQPPPARRKQLLDLKQKSPSLHMLVTSFLDQNRQEAASQGRQQVLQQQYGQPG